MKSLSISWRSLLAVIQCVLLCGVGAARLHAQQNTIGVLSGAVVDPVGSAVQNATVTVTNESSGAVSRSTTNQEGKFSVSNLPAGSYIVEVSAPGFALASRKGVHVSAEQKQDLTIPLSLGSVSDAITVEANTSNSIAAQHAPMDGLLEATSARTEITSIFIQNFTTPLADFSELTQMAPGTFSVNSNGVGLGQSKTYFRGFADGNYDIDYDGVPFYDTNDPTHHSWAFFPSPWIGGVDFDRSPGTASTIGPTPFGGSIHLLSPEMSNAPLIQAGVSYGSFNTMLIDGSIDSGPFTGRKSNLFADVHRMTSDGYQTFNYQTRDAGSLKYVYKFSENNVLTGYAGVVRFSSNTPDQNPTRGQIQQYGANFLLTSDFDSTELDPNTGKCKPSVANCLYPLNYKFYTYNIPTDLEYVDWTKQWGHGWQTDFKPYTLSYYNAQFFNNSLTTVNTKSAVDKLNSYRKYGENFAVSQISKFGIFRTGLWYEWATTNRYQIKSDPTTHIDVTLPNFHERFYTNSYQPYAEYEFRATQKLTLTAGFKYSYFNQNLTQFQDAKKVGCLGGTLDINKVCIPSVPPISVNHSAGYRYYLPSVVANYRLMNNWSVYGQFAEGTKVPPSAVFDVTGAAVSVLPKPTGVKTYQGGTVLKLKQVTLNADAYYIHFQNAFNSIPDPNNTTGFDYISSGDSVSKGFEAEANIYVTSGLSLYTNFTVGTARYVSKTLPDGKGGQVTNSNYGLWVASTPSNTEAIGLTYHQKHFDVGVFDKRVGPMWNDNNLDSGAVANQVIPINPFSVTNVFFNYVLRNGSHFDQSKIKLSINNVFDAHNIVGDQQAKTGTAYVIGGGDVLQLLPGRSFTLTITPAFSPKR